jgi:adenylate kinase family enzyme
MSGTGKSTITQELVRRGYRAIDADDGWTLPQPDGTLRWDSAAITHLLDTDEGDVLFFAGCEENMVELLPRFDIVMLLSAPRDVIVQRILGDLDEIEPRLRAIADHEVDTTNSIDQVVASILNAVEE